MQDSPQSHLYSLKDKGITNANAGGQVVGDKEDCKASSKLEGEENQA